MANKVKYRPRYNRRNVLDRNDTAPVIIEAYQDRKDITNPLAYG